ncbi:MAG: GIY-YIG nuclease family protein [bacterium]|nr:GIY-YIG nuclease family protein [bacterium]
MAERPDGHREGQGYYIKMNFVYILQSEKNGRFYIGSTNDLDGRITEHNSGKTKSLKYIRPLKIVFKKEYSTMEEAHKMELHLKKLKNKVILERIIAEGDIKMGL